MNRTHILPSALLILAVSVSAGAVAQSAGSDTEAPIAEERAQVHLAKSERHGREGRHGKRGRFGMMRQIMEQVDANGDRAVTQEEIDTYRAARVAEADVSGDGNLSLEEFETAYAQMTRMRMVDAFQELDQDGDGQITQAEMDSRFGGVVERMDRNGDGKLSREDRGRRG